MDEDLIGLRFKQTFPNSSVATVITLGTKGVLIKYFPSSEKAWIAAESLHRSPIFRKGGVDRQVEQKRAKRISLSNTRTRLNRAVEERSIVGVEIIHRGVP
jgi:hypothetical protein